MTLIRIQKTDTLKKYYAKNRTDIRSITSLSESTITKALNTISNGKMFTTKQFVISEVEVDDNSIKEVTEHV